ncbi:MAG: hypothetical protein WBC93_03540 [Sulfitobacter sp.]
MNYVIITDADASSDNDYLAALPEGVDQHRAKTRLLMTGLTTVALVSFATFASAVEPGDPGPAPDPAPAADPAPAPGAPSEPDGPAVDPGGPTAGPSGPSGGPDGRENSGNRIGRFEPDRPQISRALISDQTYYGGKLGPQPAAPQAAELPKKRRGLFSFLQRR